jgi:Lon protease-like protein
MPLFPLGTVLLPGASLPLHIFEPRYRQLTIDLVTGAVAEKQFGVVAVREGWSPDDGRGGLHDVGCTARLREVRRLPDGRFDIQTQGERRFRLLDVDDTAAPYLVGTVEWLPDLDGDDSADLAPLAMAARAAHRRYCTTAWKARRSSVTESDAGAEASEAPEGSDAGIEAEDDDATVASEPGAAVDTAELAHVLAGDCLLPLDDRQDLLAETRAAERLRMVRALMVREAGLLRELHAVWAPTARFAVPHSTN